MARLFKRKNKLGVMYGVDYIDPCGQRIRKIVSPYKEAAEIILKKIEIQIVEGKYLDIRSENKEVFLFENFAQKYSDMHINLRNKNINTQRKLLKGLVNYFRGQHLNNIDHSAIQQFMMRRIQKVKPSSVNRDISMLKSIFNR
ncbi:MAG: hypothetical protein NUV91_03000, partial [Candidatus Omnitrophica bacterium]|nr:hypothetical protein [Candidatus Omnitrophota bacterium]